jgi:hypothetical protein
LGNTPANWQQYVLRKRMPLLRTARARIGNTYRRAGYNLFTAAMKDKFYSDIEGKREFFKVPPRLTYFAAGFYETDPAGNAFVFRNARLYPLYTIAGVRYKRPEYAGQNLYQIQDFKP